MKKFSNHFFLFIIFTFYLAITSFIVLGNDYQKVYQFYIKGQFGLCEKEIKSSTLLKDISNETAKALKIRGLCQYMSGSHKQAKISFLQALIINPKITIEKSEVLDEKVLSTFKKIKLSLKVKKIITVSSFTAASYLLVTTNTTGSFILINNKRVSLDNKLFKLNPGLHELSIKKEGFKVVKLPINIPPKSIVLFRKNLEKTKGLKKKNKKKSSQKKSSAKKQKSSYSFYDFSPFALKQYQNQQYVLAVTLSSIQISSLLVYYFSWKEYNSLEKELSSIYENSNQGQDLNDIERQSYDSKNGNSSQLRAQANYALLSFTLSWVIGIVYNIVFKAEEPIKTSFLKEKSKNPENNLRAYRQSNLSLMIHPNLKNKTLLNTKKNYRMELNFSFDL